MKGIQHRSKTWWEGEVPVAEPPPPEDFGHPNDIKRELELERLLLPLVFKLSLCNFIFLEEITFLQLVTKTNVILFPQKQKHFYIFINPTNLSPSFHRETIPNL